MAPRIITILTLLLGLGLWAYSLTLPYYNDEEAAKNLSFIASDINMRSIDKQYHLHKQEYYQKEAELRTNKLFFADFGTGLAVASGTIFLFLLLTKTKRFSDFKNLKSFNNKKIIFISSNIVWLLLIPGTFLYYTLRLRRGDYPSFADSIAIPIMEQTTVYLFLLIPLNIFLFLTTITTNLPTNLFIIADKYSKPTILWEIFWGFWLLINLLCFVDFVRIGDHFSIPINLFFTFILLTLRAGKINMYKQVKENHI